MVLSDKDYETFSYEELPSNVVYPEKSNVVYRTADTNIVTVAAGTVCGVHARGDYCKCGTYNIRCGW